MHNRCYEWPLWAPRCHDGQGVGYTDTPLLPPPPPLSPPSPHPHHHRGPPPRSANAAMEDVQQAHAHERHHHWAELPHEPAQLRQAGPHVHDGRRDLPLGIAVWSPRPRSAKAAMDAEQAEEERHQHWAQVPHKAAQVRPLGPHLHDEGCEQHPLGRQTPPIAPGIQAAQLPVMQPPTTARPLPHVPAEKACIPPPWQIRPKQSNPSLGATGPTADATLSAASPQPTGAPPSSNALLQSGQCTPDPNSKFKSSTHKQTGS